MILVFDIGNTSTMVGLYGEGNVTDHFRMPSKDDKTNSIAVDSDAVAVKLRHFVFSQQKAGNKIDGIAICSVVPELIPVYEQTAGNLLSLKAWVLNSDAELGMEVAVNKPQQVGADRLANAIALKNLYGYPGFAVDLGTSTNFDVVDADGNYIGGAIAPGVKTSSAELFRRASQLYAIEISRPDKAIGKNTTDAMRSGIFYGSLGLIDHISSLIANELSHSEIKVVATGGFAGLFAPHSKYIQKVDPTLTLKGIGMAYEMNN